MWVLLYHFTRNKRKLNFMPKYSNVLVCIVCAHVCVCDVLTLNNCEIITGEALGTLLNSLAEY